MAEFTITIDGVPIPVRGSKILTREDAVDAIGKQLKINPRFIDEERNTQLQRPEGGSSSFNRFEIGRGKFASDVLDASQIAISLMTGDKANVDRVRDRAFEGHEELRKLQELSGGTGVRPQAAVERSPQFNAASVGEFVGDNPSALVGTGAIFGTAAKATGGLVASGLGSLFKNAASFMGGKKGSESFIEELVARGDLSAKEVMDLIASDTGKQVIKQLEAIKDPAIRKQFGDVLVDGKRGAEAGKAFAEQGTRETAELAQAASTKVAQSAEKFATAQARQASQAAAVRTARTATNARAERLAAQQRRQQVAEGARETAGRQAGRDAIARGKTDEAAQLRDALKKALSRGQGR